MDHHIPLDASAAVGNSSWDELATRDCIDLTVLHAGLLEPVISPSFVWGLGDGPLREGDTLLMNDGVDVRTPLPLGVGTDGVG